MSLRGYISILSIIYQLPYILLGRKPWIPLTLDHRSGGEQQRRFYGIFLVRYCSVFGAAVTFILGRSPPSQRVLGEPSQKNSDALFLIYDPDRETGFILILPDLINTRGIIWRGRQTAEKFY